MTPWLVAAWHPPWYSSYKAHYHEAECMKEEKAGHYAETVVGGRILHGRWNDVCESRYISQCKNMQRDDADHNSRKTLIED
jgi:hypothetical protein